MTGVSTEKTITAKAWAPDGKMMVSDLRKFLAEPEKAGAPGTSTPKVRATWGGALKSISVTVKDDRDQ
jgi:hypothetical protein